MSAFDPLFDLLAGLLSWFYDQVPSYGFAIIALTTLVLIVFAPLTYRSTKSMLAMRRVQPEVRRIQKKYRDDRERMNQEMMALYQEHGVSPLSSCLPILVQSPVFLVMFRVIQGITRRGSNIGYRAGEGSWFFPNNNPDAYVASELPRRGFNPEYLDPESAMYQSLLGQTEMDWIGIDLSRTPFDMLTSEAIGTSLPYLVMIAVVAFLGWYQQRQIAARQSGEINPQQQMIMRVLPWMLPIFSFTMPAALVLYFIVSSLLRVAQQAYITRSIYSDESLTAPLESDDDDDDDDDEIESPLSQLFGGGRSTATKEAPTDTRHGTRRPTSTSGKPSKSRSAARPPRDTPAEPKTSKRTTERSNSGASRNGARGGSRQDARDQPDSADRGGIWSRARRSAPAPEQPTKPTSRRVTPKKDTSSDQRRRRR